MNILVVDDSAAMRKMIAKTLHLSGIAISRIFEAAHGGEALTALEENWIDLALVDINMPIMDGETLIHNIRENDDWRHLPIIVVSTESSETRIDQLRRRGVEFIHKPFAPETVAETVANLMEVKHGAITDRSCDHDF